MSHPFNADPENVRPEDDTTFVDETQPMPLSQAVEEAFPRVNVPSIFSLEENPWGERVVTDGRDFHDEA